MWSRVTANSSVSPGSTWRRKRARSIPAEEGQFGGVALNRAAAKAPSWASDSILEDARKGGATGKVTGEECLVSVQFPATVWPICRARPPRTARTNKKGGRCGKTSAGSGICHRTDTTDHGFRPTSLGPSWPTPRRFLAGGSWQGQFGHVPVRVEAGQGRRVGPRPCSGPLSPWSVAASPWR